MMPLVIFTLVLCVPMVIALFMSMYALVKDPNDFDGAIGPLLMIFFGPMFLVYWAFYGPALLVAKMRGQARHDV